MASRNVRDTDHGWDALRRRVRRAPRQRVVIGITNTAPGGVATYATYNEFGTHDGAHPIPSRPFMRSWYDGNYPQFANMAEKAVESAMFGQLTFSQALNRIGLYAQNGIKNNIRNAYKWAKPNAQMTIDRKGSDKPLIDHSILINSVTFDIRTK